MTDAQAEALRAALDRIVAKHAASFPALTGVELHGSTMMRAADPPWRSVPLLIRFRIFEEVLQAVRDSGARVYIEGIDVRRQLARGYPTLMAARELAFSHILERLNDCCHPGEPEIKVLADDHHTAEISRSNFNRYRVAGTYGYRSSRLRHVHPRIEFIESHTDRLLQAADMVTYIYNRVMTLHESDMRAHRKKIEMWQIVDHAARWPRGRARIWP